MSEKPLDRLNYYNGERLEASDLKVEQEYHIRVLRWLNKSLYPGGGIVQGLTVTSDNPGGSSRRVVVSPGLALDVDGREIILIDAQVVTAMGPPGKSSFLTIEYAEQKIEEEAGACASPLRGSRQNGSRAASGGPTFIRAMPRLGWVDQYPPASSGRVVLALVDLNPDCTVKDIDTSVRHYAQGSDIATVRQYALEGVRDIDENNSQKVYFHIRGRQPRSVTLYLRAEHFPKYHYTEMGKHWHGGGATADNFDPKHHHPLTTSPKPEDGVSISDHYHDSTSGSLKLPVRYSRPLTVSIPTGFDFNFDDPLHPKVTIDTADYGFPWLQPKDHDPHALVSIYDDDDPARIPQPWQRFTYEWVRPGDKWASFTTGKPVTAITISGRTDDYTATVQYNPNPKVTVSSAGVTNDSYSARGGGDPHAPPDPAKNPVEPWTYFTDLQISIDGISQPTASTVSVTKMILEQINSSRPSSKQWGGLSGSNLQDSSGPIRLDLLTGIGFEEGEHVIEFQVPSGGGGGRISYNLYVE